MWTVVYQYMDGQRVATAERLDIDPDEIRYTYAPGGGAAVQIFSDINPWLRFIALDYGSNRIRLGTFSDGVLGSTDGNLFQPSLRLDSQGRDRDGDGQVDATVRLGGVGVGGTYTFRFNNETEAQPFFNFFNMVDEFVETTDLLNESPICFAGGTLIDGIDGRCPVERIRPGDVLRNSGGQLVRVLWVGRRHITAAELARNPKLRPVRIARGALGHGLPARDLLLSRQHRVLFRSPICKRMFGVPEVLIPAIQLVAMPGIAVDNVITDVTYIHLLFARHEILLAEGAPCESLFPGRQAMRTLPKAAMDELRAIFPDGVYPGLGMVLSRPVPPPRRQQRLLARHLKNKMPVLFGAAAEGR